MDAIAGELVLFVLFVVVVGIAGISFLLYYAFEGLKRPRGLKVCSNCGNPRTRHKGTGFQSLVTVAIELWVCHNCGDTWEYSASLWNNHWFHRQLTDDQLAEFLSKQAA
jgi:hypothetical protein